MLGKSKAEASRRKEEECPTFDNFKRNFYPSLRTSMIPTFVSLDAGNTFPETGGWVAPSQGYAS
jgi:hypothetical protein